MKIAIAYDYMTQMGGGERVIHTLHEIFPDAPIYTVLYCPETMSDEFREMDIRTSFVDRLPLSHKKFELYIPLFAFGMEQFDFREYDVVLSVSTMVAKGVITGPRTCHISLCFTPMRWAWDLYHDYLAELKDARFTRWAFRFWTHYYRIWDIASVSRVNYFIAGSKIAARRIRKHYGRDADVIYPPIDTKRFQPSGDPPEDFYLVVSRLAYAKRIDVVVAAFANTDRRLVVIGQGERLSHLQKIATPNIEFLGYQPDDVVRDHYSRCRALLFPGEEDFGLTPVEAQACGRPVIAYAAGGSLETVIEGATGVFFHAQTPEAVSEAVGRFESLEFDSKRIRENAERFDSEIFASRIRAFVEAKHEQYEETFFG
ncbi:MAG: glycosyltransferase [Deltaproteobacteria bacterium]|nr:glycosyltransferase [Deltaproteobacteria bacterium]MBW2725420.1 glycosyltransferase [Deltaproteobacteria bacterium]